MSTQSTEVKQLNIRLDEEVFYYLKETAAKDRKSMQSFIKDLILENFARRNGIENVTQETLALIEQNKLYMRNLRRSESQLSDIIQKVREGASLAELLGYTKNN